MRRLLACLVAAVLMLGAPAASASVVAAAVALGAPSASARDIGISFAGDADYPANVCVLTRAATVPHVAAVDLFDTKAGAVKTSKLSHVSKDELSRLATRNKRAVTTEQVAAALDDLERDDDCGAGNTIDWPSARYVRNEMKLVCRGASGPTTDATSRTVLLLIMGVDKDIPPTLEGLEFDGRAVVARIRGGRDEAVLVKLVGGHYRRGASRVSTGRSIVLPLEQRCAEHRFVLPPSGGATAHVVHSRGGKPVQELDLEDGRGKLSHQSQGNGGRFVISLRSANNPKDVARLQYHYLGRQPPIEVTPTLKQFRVSWEAPELYPVRYACPSMRLVAAARECGTGKRMSKEGKALRCEYLCQALGGGQLSLPAKVSMKWEDDVWSDVVGQVGGTLSSFVESDRRVIRLRLAEGWPSTTVRDFGATPTRIDFVELRTPGGGTYRVVPRNGSRVRIPGIQVGDVITYRAYGYREYDEEEATVKKHGYLHLKAPHESIANVVEVGLTAGGGAMAPPFGSPQPPSWRPFGSVEGILLGRPFTRAYGDFWYIPELEARLTATVGEQWYQLYGAPRRAVQARVMLGAYPTFRSESVYVGIGGGVAVLFPVEAEERRLLRLQYRPMFAAWAGWRATRSIAIETGARVIVRESLLNYEVPATGAGLRATESAYVVLTVPEFRLRIDL